MITDNRTPDTTHLTELAEAAVDKVVAWLKASQSAAGTKGAKKHANPAAERLAAVLSDPNGLDFTVGFVDRVVRTEDRKAAARALAELGNITPATLGALDRAQIMMGSKLGTTFPDIVVPVAQQRIRGMVGHMIVDARENKFGKAVAELTAGGHRLNINLLGEAVLGETEADKHLEDTRRLLARDDAEVVGGDRAARCEQGDGTVRHRDLQQVGVGPGQSRQGPTRPVGRPRTGAPRR